MGAIAYKGNIYGGATTLEELTNVNVNEPSDGQILKYDEENEKWANDDLSKSDVGLGNVDNTSDANKPISTATQAALNAKADASDIASAKTVTGNPITLTDGSETYADELVIDLEPIQDLHGYDKPWVGGAGKNILPITMEDGITDGVTYTKIFDNSGNVIGIKCQGQISGQTARYLCSEQNVPAGSYRLTGGSDVSNGGIRVVARYGNTYRDCTSAYGSSFTLSEQTSVKFYVRGQTSGKDIDITIYPMLCLESATDPTLFEQYTNISPITGYTEVNVNRCGKNLFDKDNPITIEGYISGSTGVLTAGSANEHCLAIKLKQGNYAFSRTIPSSDTTTKRFRVTYFSNIPSVGDQGTILLNADSALTGTFTMPADGYAVIFMFNGTSAWDARQEAFNSLQIETGTTVTSYEPYNGQTVSIPLGQTVYGATVDVANGVMVIDRGYVDLGAQTYGTANNRFYVQVPVKVYTTDEKANMVCSCYETKSYTNQSNFTCSSYAGYLYFMDNRCSTPADFKTAMNGQQACYELATPITIPLTPAQLKLLKGQNYISSNGTTIHLTYQPDNSVGDAVSEAEKYADRIPHGMDLLCEHYVGGSAILIPKIDLYSMLLFISYREIGDAQHSVIVVNGSMLLPVTAFKQPYNANYIPNYGNYGIEVFFVENQNDKSLIGATFSTTNIPYIDIYGIK
jgi:hypothetical protein